MTTCSRITSLMTQACDLAGAGHRWPRPESELPRGVSTSSGTGDFVELRDGEARRIALGGTGRPVVGRVVLPAGTEPRVDWSYGDAGFHREQAVPRPACGPQRRGGGP